jgi:hypothetical protein
MMKRSSTRAVSSRKKAVEPPSREDDCGWLGDFDIENDLGYGRCSIRFGRSQPPVIGTRHHRRMEFLSKLPSGPRGGSYLSQVHVIFAKRGFGKLAPSFRTGPEGHTMRNTRSANERPRLSRASTTGCKHWPRPQTCYPNSAISGRNRYPINDVSTVLKSVTS